jgi:preprotein translocase subunit SecE
MADKLTKAGKPNPPGPKKGAAPANSRLEQAQKRARAMTAGSGRGKATPPKQFFEEAWVELKKTTWPTREVLIKSTTVVLALVVATGIFVYIASTIMSRIATPLFNMH